MKTMRAAAAATVLLALAPGPGDARPASFSNVPANIADAPVKEWRSVERADKGDAYRWKLLFSRGYMWISRLHSGRYWPAWKYESESGVLGMLEKGGHSGFRRVESTASHGSKWGYMTISDKDGATCVAGIVLINDDHSHDGETGGTLRGYAVDCGAGAESRFDDWKTWFRSFKRAPSGYNAALDRSPQGTGRPPTARTTSSDWKRIDPSGIAVNLVDLGRIPAAKFEQRISDDGRLNQRVVFLGRKGGIFIERTPGTFTHRLSMLYDSEEKFVRETKKVFRRHMKRGHRLRFDRIERIRSRGDRSGHAAAVKLAQGGAGRDCIVAGVLFMGGEKRNPAADERFDTRVMLRDCSGEASFERAAGWLRSLKIVPEGYNRGVGG